jgi:surface antigen
MWRSCISIVALAFAGCAQQQPARVASPQPPLQPASLSDRHLPPPAQCALFAREFTGIRIRGDAWTWWDLAAGQYPRGDRPKPDSVVVLRSTPQLPLGHVGIVKRVVGPREITITHANWGKDDPTRRIIHDSTAVVDVSPRNDWTQLRFWNAPAHAFGKVYAAYGFIYPRAYTADRQPVW